jgi:hypothetical protein
VEARYDPGQPLVDLSAARWIEERLWPWGPGSGRADYRVGCVVPDGFAAYARVLHPAYRETDHAFEPVRWSTVASWTGKVAHPQMQFLRIANLRRGEYPSWGMLPLEGSPHPDEAERLAGILRAFTGQPERCFFALWEGFGVPELQAFATYPRINVPHRAYFLFHGPIGAVPTLSFGSFRHPPNLWWPEDQTWCVASEIDLPETYVGGTAECIARVLADPTLEAFPTSLEARADIDGDVINR